MELLQDSRRKDWYKPKWDQTLWICLEIEVKTYDIFWFLRIISTDLKGLNVKYELHFESVVRGLFLGRPAAVTGQIKI